MEAYGVSTVNSSRPQTSRRGAPRLDQA